MSLNQKHIRFVQKQLQQAGKNPGPIDGVFGEKTKQALVAVGVNPGFAKKRMIAQYIQMLAKQHSIEYGKDDAYWGPQTEYAFDALYDKLELKVVAQPVWRPEELQAQEINPNHWPHQTPESLLVDFYGNVGEHQTLLELPYPHKLAWNTRQVVQRYSCHEKVHDSLSRILSKVLSAYGIDGIKQLRLDLWGGCLNVRKMRGGSRYSMHSWGIAVDYDPDHNQYKWGRDKAAFARPEYEEWWRCWESEGWVSLGRTRNFDWMHIQAAKL